MGKLLKSCFLAVSDRPARFSRGGGGGAVLASSTKLAKQMLFSIVLSGKFT